MMTTTSPTLTWLRHSSQAVRWAHDMHQPGRALVIAVDSPPHSVELNGITVLDCAGDVLVDAVSLPAVLPHLLSITGGRKVLAYNDIAVREVLAREAGRRQLDLEHLEDGESWACIMRARSVWVGTPSIYYPLASGPGSMAAATATLDLLHRIAADSGLSDV